MARKVKVVTVSMAVEFRKSINREENREYILRTAREIASLKPDIICLPEAFMIAGCWREAQLVDPTDRDVMFDLAARYGTYVVGSLYEEKQGCLHNTVLFIDRKAQIIGRYDKIHPTEEEMHRGVVPGKKDQLPVETEFGKVAAQVCFDINWPEDWQRMADNGATIIFFPSSFPGGQLLQTLAAINQVFVVPATTGVYSGVIDNTGRLVVKCNYLIWWVSATIDLERTIFHWDYQEDKVTQIHKKYGDSVKIEVFEHEARFVLESNDPEVSIHQIAGEFGLVPFRDYIKRAERVQDEKRREARGGSEAENGRKLGMKRGGTENGGENCDAQKP